jgi:hypothetical protein
MNSHFDPHETVLTGVVKDQAAVYGIICRLRDLGLSMCSLCSSEIEEKYYAENMNHWSLDEPHHQG